MQTRGGCNRVAYAVQHRDAGALRRNHTTREFDPFSHASPSTCTTHGNETAFAAKPRGKSCRDVTPAIVSSVSSVIVGGAMFCKKKCLNDFLAKRAQQIARVKEWLAPHRTSDGKASKLPSR